MMRSFFVLMILSIILSCNSNNTESKQDTSNESLTTDSGSSFDRTENLKLSISDSIKREWSFFFSNPNAKDIFLLTIEPGMVKNSKSKLQILTIDNKIIYTQIFDTYYFVKWIYEPDTVPINIGQEAYNKFIENYCKLITPKQYKTYFWKNVNTFFEAIVSLDRSKYADLKNDWEEDIVDKNFLNEVLADSTVQLFDITCFDCDEGASIIGFSQKQNKVVTLLEHD